MINESNAVTVKLGLTLQQIMDVVRKICILILEEDQMTNDEYIDTTHLLLFTPKIYE